MKKSIIVISFLLIPLFMSYVACQSQEHEHLQLGVMGGLNICNLNTKDATNSDMIAGFNLGVFSKIPLLKFVDIQPELYVSTKGASITYNNLIVDGTARFNLTYLEMPVLCIIKVSHFINLQLGPYVSYLVDGKVSNTANVHLFNFEQNINVNDYNRMDAGIIGGVGIIVHSITMGARYSYGLTKVGKERSFLGISYIIPNATNGVINFYLSVPLL
jgi:hypothetical protein